MRASSPTGIVTRPPPTPTILLTMDVVNKSGRGRRPRRPEVVPTVLWGVVF